MPYVAIVSSVILRRGVDTRGETRMAGREGRERVRV